MYIIRTINLKIQIQFFGKTIFIYFFHIRETFTNNNLFTLLFDVNLRLFEQWIFFCTTKSARRKTCEMLTRNISPWHLFFGSVFLTIFNSKSWQLFESGRRFLYLDHHTFQTFSNIPEICNTNSQYDATFSNFIVQLTRCSYIRTKLQLYSLSSEPLCRKSLNC